MYTVGLIAMAAVALYAGFMGVDGAGLQEETAMATVVEKSYREAGQTYQTIVIDGRSHVRPQARPETFLLRLELEGREVETPVEFGLFERVEAGDSVRATFLRRRITGLLQVTNVER